MLKYIDNIKIRLNSGLGRDAFWTLVSQIVIMLVLLCVNKILSNNLSVEDFGRYNIIKRSVAVLSFVLLGGLGVSIPRYLSIYLGKKAYASIHNLLIASWFYMFMITIVVSLTYMFLYSSLIDIVIGVNDYPFYFLCLLYALSVSIPSYFFAYYRGLGNFRLFNISQIIYQLLMLVPLILLIKDLFIIISVWTIVNFIFSFLILKREYCIYALVFNHLRFCPKQVLSKLTILVKFSITRLLGDFFLFLYSAFPVLFIGNRLGLENASYYSVGVSLVTMITPVFSFLGLVLLPIVSRLLAENKVTEARRIVSKLTFVYILIAIFFSSVLYLGMNLMIQIFFSSQYLVAAKIGKIIALSLLPQSLYLLYRNPNDAASSIPFNTFILAISLVVLIIGFMFSTRLIQYAYVYLMATVFQGTCSCLVWKYISK